MQSREEQRAQWSADKRQKIETLERRHKNVLENIFGTLMRINSLAAKPVPEKMIETQCQALVTISDLGALIDTLESMGKIDRVDFMSRCVERFESMARIIETGK